MSATKKWQPPKEWKISERGTDGFYELAFPHYLNYATNRNTLVILANRIEKVIRYWSKEAPSSNWRTRIVRESNKQ